MGWKDEGARDLAVSNGDGTHLVFLRLELADHKNF